MKGYNYVRFKRGYRSELDALLKQNRQDNNTIYFLEDTKEIYVDGIWYSSIDNFSELADVDVTDINDGSLLVYRDGKLVALPTPSFEGQNATAAQLILRDTGDLYWSPLMSTSIEGLNEAVESLQADVNELKDIVVNDKDAMPIGADGYYVNIENDVEVPSDIKAFTVSGEQYLFDNFVNKIIQTGFNIDCGTALELIQEDN